MVPVYNQPNNCKIVYRSTYRRELWFFHFIDECSKRKFNIIIFLHSILDIVNFFFFCYIEEKNQLDLNMRHSRHILKQKMLNLHKRPVKDLQVVTMHST